MVPIDYHWKSNYGGRCTCPLSVQGNYALFSTQECTLVEWHRSEQYAAAGNWRGQTAGDISVTRYVRSPALLSVAV